MYAAKCTTAAISYFEKTRASAPGSAKRTPEEWLAKYGLDIADPDGWRSKGDPAWDEPIDLPDFWRRFGMSTARMVDQATRDRIIADVQAAYDQVP